MNPESLATFIVASLILSLAPGPDNIFVLTQSALYGKRPGIIITLGLCTGLIAHTTAVALGVAAIFLVSASAFTVLKLIGACYLLYLAWQAWKASASSLDNSLGTTLPSAGALYRRGIIMNLSNPKIAIFFLAFLPQFADPAIGNMTFQLFILGAVFILVSLIIFCTIASLSGLIAEYFKRSKHTQTLLNRIAALVFTGLALRLATVTR
ncbi:MAG: LysE family translocator [Gammaproteobacteria bacterium]|jgi:threonine/homoserine/homoserine lactone efflux protein|nr:LysE family translocator [Gammaproteobacteria bacterium]MBT6042858.1 LysE family translocator [Gammaproteobacteria bacterium]